MKQATDHCTEAGNVFTLITSKNQEKFDTPTPFPVSPFESDFVGADINTLAEFCEANFPEKHECISDDTFAVLDERGIKESSVLLVSWSVWEDEDSKTGEETGEEIEETKVNEGYKSVRVRFPAAGMILIALTVNFYIVELQENDFDQDGVYKWTPNYPKKS